MYMMKLEAEQVTAMYHIRETLREQGIKYPIAKQVRDAISRYTSDLTVSIKEGQDISIINTKSKRSSK